jgi:hypothetical protein
LVPNSTLDKPQTAPAICLPEFKSRPLFPFLRLDSRAFSAVDAKVMQGGPPDAVFLALSHEGLFQLHFWPATFKDKERLIEFLAQAREFFPDAQSKAQKPAVPSQFRTPSRIA